MPFSDPSPGARLVRAPPLVAALALAFNVYYLRRAHPGLISGKLSDLAINFLLPVMIVASVEWLLYLRAPKRPFSPLGSTGVMLSCLVGGTYFILLKTWSGFTPIHCGVVSALGAVLPGTWGCRNTVDPWDLLTLVSTGFAWIFLTHRHERSLKCR